MHTGRPSASPTSRAGRTFDHYRDNEMLRAAVERQFTIIGEAFTGLRRVDPTLAANIDHLPRIVAFRNVLVHAYASVDDRLVWDVVESHLPGLRARLEELLRHNTDPRPES
jgi:uncharacterized protein with HEPN domain